MKLVTLTALIALFSVSPVWAQIDPSIPLRVQPPQQLQRDWLEDALKMQQLKLQQQEMEQRQQEIDAQRQQQLVTQRSAAASQNAGQSQIPSVESMLKPDQFVEAGLLKLNRSEMAQLNAWFSDFVTRYTALLYSQFEDRSKIGSPLSAETRTVGEVLEAGGLIRMQDGSEWRVAAGGSMEASLWLPVSEVVIVRAQNSSSAMLVHEREAIQAVRVK